MIAGKRKGKNKTWLVGVNPGKSYKGSEDRCLFKPDIEFHKVNLEI